MKVLILLFTVLVSALAHAQLSNESELGIASANGNTRTQTYTAKQLNEYKLQYRVLSFKSRYLNGKTNGVETARYLMGGFRWEEQFNRHYGIFLGETFEKDKFAQINHRLITDLGNRYRFIDREDNKLFSEVGYRYMDEDRIDGSKVLSNYGRVYSEWERKWNPNFTSKYWAEYLPNLTDPKDWQFNSEISGSAVLSSVFSLKTGFLLRYDKLPAPGVRYDTDTLFTTTLVAKF